MKSWILVLDKQNKNFGANLWKTSNLMWKCMNNKFSYKNVKIMNFGTKLSKYWILVWKRERPKNYGSICQKMKFWSKILVIMDFKSENVKIVNFGEKVSNSWILVQNYQNHEIQCESVKTMKFGMNRQNNKLGWKNVKIIK